MLRAVVENSSGKPSHAGAAAATRDFRATADGYVFTLLELGVQFEVDRLRRDRHELIGELVVRCDLPGARTVAGALPAGDFNFSSIRARQDRAKLLAERSRAQQIDWLQLLEEFTQRVLASDRAGQPAIVLRDAPQPERDSEYNVLGLTLPKDHGTIIFGDGGTLKSYLVLLVLGELEQQGIPTCFVDWELDARAHRDRLERLFGDEMPSVRYVRAERALVHEVDRLRRIFRDGGIRFAAFDSVAFGCDGPPEAAESAASYFRACRRLEVGSVHVAHVTKGDTGDQKPFGSVFWHNSARSTWFAKQASAATDGSELTIGLFNRKSNLGPLKPAVGLRFAFDELRTSVRRMNVADVDDLAESLPLATRMAAALKCGAKTIAVLADELGAKPNSITQVVKRRNRTFTKVLSGDGIHRIGLVHSA